MPKLKYIMENVVNPAYRLLRGKTIECISLIGLAVGKEKFMQDCNQVMQLLLKTQTDQDDMADDDPQVRYGRQRGTISMLTRANAKKKPKNVILY